MRGHERRRGEQTRTFEKGSDEETLAEPDGRLADLLAAAADVSHDALTDGEGIRVDAGNRDSEDTPSARPSRPPARSRRSRIQASLVDEADVIVDTGAYSIWPSGPFMETGMAARNRQGVVGAAAVDGDHLHAAAAQGCEQAQLRIGLCRFVEHRHDDRQPRVGAVSGGCCRRCGRHPGVLRQAVPS